MFCSGVWTMDTMVLYMKVGDIVRQNNKLIEVRSNSKKPRTGMVGVVVAMRAHQYLHIANLDSFGNLVDVLWSNGNLTENFAEAALDVVNEDQ